jgi:diadenosine tetraphosphatase ApaH/serine/threonine PP2A family protein phosphatase
MPSSIDFKPQKNVNVLTLPFPRGRVIAIGDVHGCIVELEELLVKLDPGKDDLVVFLGDLVDRGDDSEAVVQRVKYITALGMTHCVLGNHDEKCIRYHYHQLKAKEDPKYKVPMRCPGVYNELSESSLEFLNSLPHAVFIPKEGTEEPYSICFVHAGLAPSLFNQPASAFIRNRYFTRNVKDNKLTPVKSVEIDNIWYVPEGSYPWHHYFKGDWTVLFGHSVNWSPIVENNCIGIDGGCVFGGCLRAWVKPPGGSSYFVEVASNAVT